MTNATHSSLARLYRCAVCDRRRRIQWTRVEMRLYAGQPGRDETVSCGSAIRSHKRPSLCVGRGPGGTKRAGLAGAPAASCEVDRTGQLHVVVGRVCMCTCGNLLLRSSHRYSHKVTRRPRPPGRPSAARLRVRHRAERTATGHSRRGAVCVVTGVCGPGDRACILSSPDSTQKLSTTRQVSRTTSGVTGGNARRGS